VQPTGGLSQLAWLIVDMDCAAYWWTQSVGLVDSGHGTVQQPTGGLSQLAWFEGWQLSLHSFSIRVTISVSVKPLRR